MEKNNKSARNVLQTIAQIVIIGTLAIYFLLSLTGLASKFSIESLETFLIGTMIVSGLLLIISYFLPKN